MKIPEIIRTQHSDMDKASLRRLIAFVAFVAMTATFVCMGVFGKMNWEMTLSYPAGLLMIRLIFYKIEMTSDVVIKVVKAWKGIPDEVKTTVEGDIKDGKS